LFVGVKFFSFCSSTVIHDHIVLATADGHIRFVTSNGESRTSFLDGPSPDRSRRVLDMSFQDGFLALLLEHSIMLFKIDRDKFLDLMKEDQSDVPLVDEASFLDRFEVSQECVSISLTHGYLAAGSSTGAVLIYKVFGPPNVSLVFHRSLTLKEWSYTVSDTGVPSSLSFSPSGHSIAVGYSTRGLTIWTIQGCLSFSTVPSVSSPPVTGELFQNGIHSICWSQDQSSLLVVGNGRDQFAKIPLMRTVPTNPTILLGGGRVAIWKRLISLNAHQDPTEVDAGDWDIIQIHGAYLRDNWPITKACLSPSEDQLAVSGVNGVALYNRVLGKWRVFGNIIQEKSIAASDICWVGEYIICIVSGKELLFYPRTHLDNKSLIHREKLKFACQSIDVSIGPYGLFVVSVYLEDGTIECMEVQCYIVEGKNKKLRDYPVQREEFISLEELSSDKISFKLEPLGSSQLNQPFEIPEKISLWWRRTATKEVVLGVLVLFNSGELLLVNVSKSAALGDASLVATDIEQFWTQNFPQSENFFCTYGFSFGFEIWFANLAENATTPLQADGTVANTPRRRHSFGLGSLLDSESLFEYNAEVHPLCVDWSLGIVVGVHRSARYATFDIVHGPCFTAQTQVQPFADGVLRYLVTEGSRKSQDIVSFASSLKNSSPYFFHSLELLLHTIMDYDVLLRVSHSRNPRKMPHSDSDLTIAVDQWMPRVLEFLSNFDEYHEVIANCARKTDFSHWGRLFPLAGTPSQLYEDCLKSGRLDVASKYLLILQRYDGSIVAHRQGLRLLQMLRSDHVLEYNFEGNATLRNQLESEVKRFLRMSRRRKESDMNKGQRHSLSEEVEEEEEEETQPKPTGTGIWGWFGW
jgi:WD40 repeat protein